MNKKRNALLNKAKKEVGRFAGIIGKWDPAIKALKSNTELKNLETRLDKKIELRKRVQNSSLNPFVKRGHLAKIMELGNDVNKRREIFEKQLKEDDLTKFINDYIKPDDKKMITNPLFNFKNNFKVSNNPLFNKLPLPVRVGGRAYEQSRPKASNVRGKNNKMPELKLEKPDIPEVKVSRPPSQLPRKIAWGDAVKSIKTERVMNSVRNATKIAKDRKELEASYGTERVKLARKQAAESDRNKGKSKASAAGLFSTNTGKTQEETKIGISDRNRIKKSGEEAEAKRKKKAELRKLNKQAALKTGRSVKSTQKKEQVKRKSK
jgi:hypothetical protein